MAGFVTDLEWKWLLDNIEKKRCTPFLGAGACAGYLPPGAKLASKWAIEYSYPLGDSDDLSHVAQYIAVQTAPNYPNELLAKEILQSPTPNFDDPRQIHSVIASLGLPIYVTTNYDNFMTSALKAAHLAPERDFCRWNKSLRDPQFTKRNPVIFNKKDREFRPTPETPLVFHLHGIAEEPTSMVLTEDDYIEFLINVSKTNLMLPPLIQGAFSEASVLFLGYRLADLNFRVLFRMMSTYLSMVRAERVHVSVQISPLGEGSAPENQRAIEYLNKYFGRENIRVFWGTCEQFVAQLHERWTKRRSQPAAAGS